jgi:hypothetical protein
MNYWVHFQILLFCIIIGTGVSLFLGAQSYIKIALVVLLIYIPIEIYYTYKLSKALVPVVATLPQLVVPPPLVNKAIAAVAASAFPEQQTITADGSLINLPRGTSIPINTITSNLLATQVTQGSQLDYHPRKPEEGNKFATEKSLEESNYAIFQHPVASPTINSSGIITPTSQSTAVAHNQTTSGTYSLDKPPFDGLDPKELMNRLNYIYYATAQPAKRINYHDFKTHADRILNSDGTKLSVNDPKLQTYAAGYYPQLTANQIDARDCLNNGSGEGSCFQSPQLFYNKEHNFNILDKGVNLDNANLIVREDFSMPINLEAITSKPLPLDVSERKQKILFLNAPKGTLDIPLDQVSNETLARSGKLDSSMDTCYNCKLAVCRDDYCSLQNSLFM